MRRAANAVVKVLAESELPLTVLTLLRSTGQSSDEVTRFLRERLSYYLKDVRGFDYDVVKAGLAEDLPNVHGLSRIDDIRDIIARVEALSAERGSADFLAVSHAFKRIKNIIRSPGSWIDTARSPSTRFNVHKRKKRAWAANRTLRWHMN